MSNLVGKPDGCSSYGLWYYVFVGALALTLFLFCLFLSGHIQQFIIHHKANDSHPHIQGFLKNRLNFFRFGIQLYILFKILIISAHMRLANQMGGLQRKTIWHTCSRTWFVSHVPRAKLKCTPGTTMRLSNQEAYL